VSATTGSEQNSLIDTKTEPSKISASNVNESQTYGPHDLREWTVVIAGNHILSSRILVVHQIATCMTGEYLKTDTVQEVIDFIHQHMKEVHGRD
jgi:hypothetical protein